MKALFLLFIFLISQNSMAQKNLLNSKDLFLVQPFISHEGLPPWGSYVAMNIFFNPVEKIRLWVEKQPQLDLQSPLKHRGEAHITVITPVEWDQVLKKHLTIQEVNLLAEQMSLQKSHWQEICVGMGQKTINNKLQKTFFIVVESVDLVNFRKAVQDLFVKKGGLAQHFDPQLFFPHITLGFTDKDLHYEDGVIKDKKSCVL